MTAAETLVAGRYRIGPCLGTGGMGRVWLARDEVLRRDVAIKEIALPFRPPQLQLQQYWHRRMQNDPANRWLRGLFYDVNRREAGAQMPG